MFRWIVRRALKRRVVEYLKYFPDDEAAVFAVLSATELFSPKNVREVAEMSAGRQLSDEEWTKLAPRWERVWTQVGPP